MSKMRHRRDIVNWFLKMADMAEDARTPEELKVLLEDSTNDPRNPYFMQLDKGRIAQLWSEACEIAIPKSVI